MVRDEYNRSVIKVARQFFTDFNTHLQVENAVFTSFVALEYINLI